MLDEEGNERLRRTAVPTWQQLLDWVNNPNRTRADLRQACHALGLNANGTINELRTRLQQHVQTQPNQAEQATWAPPGWQPVQAAPPTPPAPPVQQQRVVPWQGWALAGLGALAGILLLVLLWTAFVQPAWARGGQPVTPTATATPVGSVVTNTPGPAAQPSATSTVPAQASPTPPSGGVVAIPACTFPTPSRDLDSMPKSIIEMAQTNTWFHRVFNPRLFRAPNWDGADSWFVSLALGPSSGGAWTSHGNSGQIVFRGTSTQLSWCLGVLTTEKWKEQFMGPGNTPAAINVRIVPNSAITVVTASGKTISQVTSDAGDITIIMPNSGVIIISVAYTTASPTHESLVWWGPYDRSVGINTIDAR